MALQKYILLFCIIFTSICFASASTVENKSPNNIKIVWECKDMFTDESILWLVEWGENSYIKIFDELIQAVYSLQGLNKRWDWDLNFTGSSYNYAIILGPNKKARYYDFSIHEEISATELYICDK